MEGKVLQAPLVCPGHSRGVVQVSYTDTPDGLFLISACLDSKPMIRRGETGDWVGTFEGHKGAVWSAKLNPPGLRAATGSADFSAKLWDALSGDQLHEFNCSHIVKSVDFSQDSKQLLCGGKFKKLKLFDLTKLQPIMDLEGHSAGVKSALFLPCGTKCVSGGEDKILRVWDLKSKQQIKQVEVQKEITSMQLSTDGAVLTLTSGTQVHFWDTATMEMIKTLDCPIDITSASLSPDRKKFIAGGPADQAWPDPWVHVFDYETGEEIECLKGHHGHVWDVAFAPDGETYASGADDGTIRIWQTDPG
ncbi:WD40-repeat-containing domain protein [Baffinella frigidus]|nr:WD40-repeat-containing domain protein [Cryptophyta sp. CCMP2293]